MESEGSSLVEILGPINFLLLLFQRFSGQHWIEVKIGLHRKVSAWRLWPRPACADFWRL